MVTSALNVELDGATQEVIRVEVAENHVAVRNRNRGQAAFWPASTDAIACAIRTQLDGLAVRVNADEAARTGAHRVHRHQRQRQNQSSHVRIRLDREVPLGDQRHVEAGAANVRACNVLVAERIAQELGTDHAADWAGHDRASQFLGLPADGAAVRGHHAQCKLGAVLCEAIGHKLECCTRRFCAIGLQNRRVHAVTFLARRIVVNRSEHWNRRTQLGELFLADVPSALLACAVLVSLQQADHDSLGTSLNQFPGGNANFLFTQRNDNLALHVRALSNAAGAMNWHQRVVVAVRIQVNTVFKRVAKIALQSTAHGMDLLKAAIDHQAHIETLALQHAIQHGSARINARHQFRVNIINRTTPVRQSVN